MEWVTIPFVEQFDLKGTDLSFEGTNVSVENIRNKDELVTNWTATDAGQGINVVVVPGPCVVSGVSMGMTVRSIVGLYVGVSSGNPNANVVSGGQTPVMANESDLGIGKTGFNAGQIFSPAYYIGKGMNLVITQFGTFTGSGTLTTRLRILGKQGYQGVKTND